MQEININREKAREFKKNRLKERIEAKCNCKINIIENTVIINADPYNEFIAKNIIHAFGRGFNIDAAECLLQEDYYFSSINIKNLFKSKERIRQVKARLIGRDGKAKNYIEKLSNTKISIYGNTISFIGDMEGISEAEIGINSIIYGFNHGIAYAKMQKQHKKNKLNQIKLNNK